MTKATDYIDKKTNPAVIKHVGGDYASKGNFILTIDGEEIGKYDDLNSAMTIAKEKGIALKDIKVVVECMGKDKTVKTEAKGDLLWELEEMVDKNGLGTVLDTLATMCGEKAEHVMSNYQDEGLQKKWLKAADILSDADGKISKLDIP